MFLQNNLSKWRVFGVRKRIDLSPNLKQAEALRFTLHSGFKNKCINIISKLPSPISADPISYARKLLSVLS